MKPGHLYFLQIEPFGPIKIGWTTGCVSIRMRAIQQASPHELKWLGAVEGPRSLETWAHRKLEPHRLRNEWLNPTPEVMAFVRQSVGNFDATAYIEFHFRPSLQARFRALANYREAVNDQLCATSGVDDRHIFQWLNNSRLLSQQQLDAIEAAVASAEKRNGTTE
jgi:hypothetical protein